MIGKVLVAAVAAIHGYILVLEMFLWTTPRGLKAFGNTESFATSTAVMAANQGLYNGFLAAGLLWALWLGVAREGRSIALFFLGCVAVAGVFGTATTGDPKIVLIQTLPAALAIIAVWLRR